MEKPPPPFPERRTAPVRFRQLSSNLPYLDLIKGSLRSISPDIMSQALYSVEQVAQRLGLHVKTVRGYVREGKLKAVRIGKQYRIAREDFEALLGQHPGGLDPD